MARRSKKGKRHPWDSENEARTSASAPPVPIWPAFFKLFYRPYAAVNEIVARPPSWRSIIVFLAIIAFIRTLLESAWNLAMAGELLNTLRQPWAIWGYRIPFVTFFAANLGTVYLRVALFAFIVLAIGKFLGGRGHFEPLLRLYGVILGLFALTVIPDFISVWVKVPFIAFHASHVYSPQIGIGQILSSTWLTWISYVVVVTVHRIKPFDAFQTALALTLANTGLLVLVAEGLLNLPYVPSTSSPALWLAGNVLAFVGFSLLTAAVYLAGAWIDRMPTATMDRQVDFTLRGYFEPRRSLVPVLPGRFQIVWPLIAILLVLAILIVSVANLFVSPRAPKAHAAGYAGPAWVLQAQAAPKASYSGDHILVRFKQSVTAAEQARVLGRHGLHQRSVIADIGVVVASVPAGTDPRSAVVALGSELSVAYAEPDYLVHAVSTYTPNDTYYAKSYASSHYGSVTQYGPQKINAPTAWGTYHASNTLKLAVVDTGIDNTNPDLSGRVLTGYNYVANNANTTDDNGHGTHVAGIAAAISNNKTGIASICFNACQILPVKVLDNTGTGTTSNVASGITYAADQGARVINLSLGTATYSQALQSAVDYAWGKNAVIVAAGGNDGSNIVEYPAGDDHVLGVAATDANDADTSFSDWGNQIGVAAPGNAILSTMPTYAVYLTTNNGYYEKYDALSGTSMSSPHVAGLAGLLIAYKGPSISNLGVYEAIQQGADADSVSYPPAPNGGWEPHNGYGRLDAGNTLNGTYRTASVGSIVGQVTDANGNPVAGATVGAGTASATTGSDGMYRLANLAASGSPYSVTAGASGYSFNAQSVSVISGADTFAVFQALPPPPPSTIQNGGFESGAFTPWVTGGGAPSPVITSAQVHSGAYSAQLGQSAGAEPSGDSYVYQSVQVSIPTGATKATLTYWYWPYTTDTVQFDWQECQIRNSSGSTLAQVMKLASNAQSWQQATFDLTPYNGQTIQVYFNDHEDGAGDLTYMYLDDVSLTYQ